MENGFDHEVSDPIPTIGQRAVMASRERKVMGYMQPPDGFGGEWLQFTASFAKAKAKLPRWIQNDAKGAHGATYATLKKIMSTIEPVLSEEHIFATHSAHGLLRVEQAGGAKGYVLPVTCTLVHWPSGGFRESRIDMPVVQFNPQAVASAYSYGKRYATLAACGLATDDEDDDGEKSMGNKVDSDGPIVAKCKDDLDACKTNRDIDVWLRKNASLLQRMDPADYEKVEAYGKKRREECQA